MVFYFLMLNNKLDAKINSTFPVLSEFVTDEQKAVTTCSYRVVTCKNSGE